jgi:putative membrane protein
MRAVSLALALACLAGGTALAQPDTKTPCLIEPDLRRADLTFVSDAGVASLGAIAMAELALERGSPEVRDVARVIRDDSKRIREQLRLHACRQGVKLAEQPLPDQRITYDRLSVLSGKAFDAAYLAEVERYGDAALSMFGNEAQNGSDDTLRGFAREMLPSLRITQETAKAALRRR